jgi:hypothetical protein
MINNQTAELRRIRITLVIIAIIVAFTSGSHTVTVDHQPSVTDSESNLSVLIWCLWKAAILVC